MQNLERLWSEAQQPDDNQPPNRSKYINIMQSKQLVKKIQVLHSRNLDIESNMAANMHGMDEPLNVAWMTLVHC